MKNFLKRYAFLFYISGAVIALDQWTKSLVRANLGISDTWTPWDWLEPYARIVHWKNTGAAFGMLQGFSDMFTVLAIVVAIAIVYYYPRVPKEDWLLRLAMGLQFGGALGNLIDRLTIGWVTDFISLGSFPVFNVADASISIGVAILILDVWSKERRQKQVKKSTDPEPSSESIADPLAEETVGE